MNPMILPWFTIYLVKNIKKIIRIFAVEYLMLLYISVFQYINNPLHFPDFCILIFICFELIFSTSPGLAKSIVHASTSSLSALYSILFEWIYFNLIFTGIPEQFPKQSPFSTKKSFVRIFISSICVIFCSSSDSMSCIYTSDLMGRIMLFFLNNRFYCSFIFYLGISHCR